MTCAVLLVVIAASAAMPLFAESKSPRRMAPYARA
jgi:hypothetical protein